MKNRTVIRRSSSHEVNRFTENAIEMHENRKGDKGYVAEQRLWNKSTAVGTRRVLNMSSPGCQTRSIQGTDIQCQCEDSGQRALEGIPCLTSRLLEQLTGRKIHDNDVTGQTARWALVVHTNCVRRITTSKVHILSSIVTRQITETHHKHVTHLCTR